jgi:hypothetical protein
VYFGDKLPERIARAHGAVSEIAANCAAMATTGRSYSSILEEHKKLLTKLGFDGEWQGHYPGGRTGYFLCQANLSLDPARTVGEREAFEWFITVPGAKVAELTLKDGEDVSLASNTGHWPSKTYGRFEIPEILMR